MKKLLILACIATLTGCSSAESNRSPDNMRNGAEARIRKTESAFADSFSTKGASIEIRLGLTAGRTSLSEIMVALPKVLNSPAECDMWLERWAQSVSDVHYDISCEKLNGKYLYSSIPVSEKDKTTWPLPRNGLRILQASHTLDGILDASYQRVYRANSADRIPNLEMLRESEDKKWAEESIYWLTYLAATWPEHLSSAEFGRKNDEANKLMWKNLLVSNPQRAHELQFFGEDGLVRPCFDWSTNRAYTLPLSEHATWYYIGLRDKMYEPGLTRETALFWAAVFTIHFRSTYGAEKLREFRDKHAMHPDNSFWREVSKTTQSLIVPNKER